MSKNGRHRPHRPFTDEFEAGAVRLVLGEGKGISGVARGLQLRRRQGPERSVLSFLGIPNSSSRLYNVALLMPSLRAACALLPLA